MHIETALVLRLLAGMFAAGVITGVARQRGTLTAAGQWAAFACGLLAAMAGWAWAFLLVAFFLSVSALTHWHADEKMVRTERSVPQRRERDALQVFANGGVFVFLAAAAYKTGSPHIALAALGALAAANADTWSTEIGTFLGTAPRSILTWRRVPVGMSGGISFWGSLASLAGALFIAGLALAMHAAGSVPQAAAVAAGGVIGGLVDSLLGATLQGKRWCDRCGEWTERRVHPCGFRTKHGRGFYWMTNDVVNLLTTMAGAVATLVVARILHA